MVSQHKGVSTFIFLTSLIKHPAVQSQQLALPNEILSKASGHKIAVKEFTAPYSDYLSHLTRVQNVEKFFISTN